MSLANLIMWFYSLNFFRLINASNVTRTITWDVWAFILSLTLTRTPETGLAPGVSFALTVERRDQKGFLDEYHLENCSVRDAINWQRKGTSVHFVAKSTETTTGNAKWLSATVVSHGCIPVVNLCWMRTTIYSESCLPLFPTFVPSAMEPRGNQQNWRLGGKL